MTQTRSGKLECKAKKKQIRWEIDQLDEFMLEWRGMAAAGKDGGWSVVVVYSQGVLEE